MSARTVQRPNVAAAGVARDVTFGTCVLAASRPWSALTVDLMVIDPKHDWPRRSRVSP
ncbi:MAG TPA: hypothetical protein VFC33_00640 [Acidimicrobiia bacterium]|nr:hypothetical protein [Acidimicrobiia bacterium]